MREDQELSCSRRVHTQAGPSASPRHHGLSLLLVESTELPSEPAGFLAPRHGVPLSRSKSGRDSPLPIEAVPLDLATASTISAALLTRPANTPCRAGVVLLRSPTLPEVDSGEIDAFEMLSEHLASKGFAVLRWNDAEAGGRRGDGAPTPQALVEEVGKALEALAMATGVQRNVVLGHGEGALIATRAAGRWPTWVHGLIHLAGTGRPGAEVVVDRLRQRLERSGADTVEIATQLERQKWIVETWVDTSASVAGERSVDEMLPLLAESFRSSFPTMPSQCATDLSELEVMLRRVLAEDSFRLLLSIDPLAELRRVTCPVLALGGSEDPLASTTLDLPQIVSALRATGNPDVTAVALDGHDRLFRDGNEAVSTDGSSARSWSARSLEAIQRWLAHRF